MLQFTGHVYKITNKITDDIYIGQTRTSLNKRFTSHKCEANKDRYTNLLYDNMREYGIENFEVASITEIKTETKEELARLLNISEIEHIKLLRPAYNSAPGGLGVTGVEWTPERRERFKELMSGENNRNFGKPLPEETRKKLSESLKGRIIPEETRQKTSQTMKGVRKSDETRKKMKEAANNRTNKMPTGKDHHNSKSVEQYDLNGTLINTFESIHQAASELSLQTSGICMCCKGKLKTSGGFVWKLSQSTSEHESICD
jgi:group I intron endonuclease